GAGRDPPGPGHSREIQGTVQPDWALVCVDVGDTLGGAPGQQRRHALGPVRTGSAGAAGCAPSVVRPRRCEIVSATRNELAMIVSVGFTAVLDTKKLESAT